MSNAMNAKPQRRVGGKKLSGCNIPSFRSANTQYDILPLDETIGFLQSGPELTFVLSAKVLQIEQGLGHLRFAYGACEDNRPLLHLYCWEQGNEYILICRRLCRHLVQELPVSQKDRRALEWNIQSEL
jgi:hypothetical protein